MSPTMRRPGLIALLVTAGILVGACGSAATPTPAASSAAASSGPAAGETVWQRSLREKTVTWGAANEPPATVWPSEADALTGQGPEGIKVVFGLLGITNFKGVRLEFSGLIPGLQAKRFDLIANSLTIREARCSQVAFSNPVFIGAQGLAVKKGNPLGIHSMKDIAANPNIKVGVLQGAIEIDFLKNAGVPDAQVIKFPDNPSVFAALKTGRVDALQMEAAPMLYELAGLKDPNLEQALPFARPLDANGKEVIAYQAVSFRKEDADMRDAFNGALAQALSSGALLKSAEPFYGTKDNMPPAGVTAAQLCPGGN